jgi:amidase
VERALADRPPNGAPRPYDARVNDRWDDLLFASAGDQARAVASGAVGAEELLDAQLARLRAVDRVVRAVVHLDEAGARAAARAADAPRRAGEPLGPLHGVPVTVKDWIDVAGMPCTGGAAAHRSRVPERDATAVARLRAAGVVVMGKTNVGERSEAFGPTFNPHDPTRTPTGSSSGAAALVAAGGCALGLGSDSGGSLRQPAHACGVATIRPSSGRVPLSGHFPVIVPLLDPRTVIGPLARRVADLALALRVLEGPDGVDASAAPMPWRDPDDVAVDGLRIAWWIDQPDCAPTPETAATITRAVRWLEEAGATVVEDRPAGLDAVLPLTRTYWSLAESDDVDEWVPTASSALGADDVQRFRFEWDRFRRGLTAFLAAYDAVVLPAAERPAVRHGADAGSIAPTLTFSLGGQPAVVVPCGRDPDGLPIGVQVVARVGADAVALAVAGALERAGGGWWRPAGVP